MNRVSADLAQIVIHSRSRNGKIYGSTEKFYFETNDIQFNIGYKTYGSKPPTYFILCHCFKLRYPFPIPIKDNVTLIGILVRVGIGRQLIVTFTNITKEGRAFIL